MPWETKYYKGDEVFVRTDSDGRPVVEDGRAEIKYRDDAGAALYHPSADRLFDDPDGARGDWREQLRRREERLDEREEQLQARTSELDRREAQLDEWQDRLTDRALGGETGDDGTNGADSDIVDGEIELPGEPRAVDKSAPPAVQQSEPPQTGVLEVHTDGACAGNPGPCSYGLVIREDDEYLECSGYLGDGTNNIAELNGIRAALELLGDRETSVRIYTDSRYCIGVLTEGWNVNSNRDLVFGIRNLIDDYDDLEIRKVEGHAGQPLNERADRLAKGALP